MTSILLTKGTIINSDGESEKDILMEDGIIKQIGSIKSGDEVIDATGLLIFPGLIDCHVHFREPGFPEKATMQSEALSARAGGVTLVCDMPNTNPPTSSVTALQDKISRAEKVKDCDIRFFFGITEKEHLGELKTAWQSEDLRKKLAGVKLYLDHSTGNQKVEGAIVEEIFKTCAEYKIPLVAHCEDSEINQKAAEENASEDISAHSTMRPPESEAASIEFALGLAQKYGTQFHVAHLSTAQGLGLVGIGKKNGISVTCEVSPHHLFLNAGDYTALGTLGKMNPPLRQNEHSEALLEGVKDGTVDCIATDHAPHTLVEKQVSPLLDAPSGVPGVETMLPLLLTAHEQVGGYEKIVELCFTNPNRIFSLGRKGIEEGAFANLSIIDPNAAWTISGSSLHSQCKWTPFEGWKVQGKVMKVFT